MFVSGFHFPVFCSINQPVFTCILIQCNYTILQRAYGFLYNLQPFCSLSAEVWTDISNMQTYRCIIKGSTGDNILRKKNFSAYASLMGKQFLSTTAWRYQPATLIQTPTGTARTNAMSQGRTDGGQTNYSSLHTASAHAAAFSDRQQNKQTNKQSQQVEQCTVRDRQQTIKCTAGELDCATPIDYTYWWAWQTYICHQLPTTHNSHCDHSSIIYMYCFLLLQNDVTKNHKENVSCVINKKTRTSVSAAL